MSINSIEVRIHLNYKFNVRLSNFIINSSILNSYSRYFLVSVSNLFWIVVWRYQATPTYGVRRYAACRELVSYGRRRRVFLGKKFLSVCAGYRPGESLWLHSNGVSGKSAFHKRSNLSWLSEICNHFGEIAAGSRKSLTLIKQNGGFLGKKDPLRANFHKCFPSPHMRTRKHVFLCKFREIWPTGSRWNRALFNGQKTISARAPAAASARIAPKICQGQLQTICSEFPKFHSNPFTSGGVIVERVNIVETRHKVFPILGEASSPSNNCLKLSIRYLIIANKLYPIDRYLR